MRTFKLTIAYDGTDYAGWQVQLGQKTVQGELEQALRRITGRSVRVVGSGRTDAGVHAVAQVASTELETRLTGGELRNALNANTARDICIEDVSEVESGFHAIRDAVRKRYRYFIDEGQHPDVFARNFRWYVKHTLDLSAMRDAASMICGQHDFRSFQAAGSERASTVRTIFEISVKRTAVGQKRCLIIEVEADGFLYNMVRNIVGTLVEIGRGEHPATWIQAVLVARDRTVAGPTAPAKGLFLLRVDYAV